MKILLFRDETVSVDLDGIVANLNRIFGGAVSFGVGKSSAEFPGSFVENPTSYSRLSKRLKSEVAAVDFGLIVTKKPYDNNFFWDSPKGGEIILSCFAWEELTTLPISNGLVYVLSSLLSDRIGLKVNSHKEVTGCINDFLWDKSGIDVGMRSAFVCNACLKEFSKKKLNPETAQIYSGLLKLLNDLSVSSRANNDILSFWGVRILNPEFDVFLCHNSDDKVEVRSLNNHLKQLGLKPWLDEEQLRPGFPWQDQLDKQIGAIRAAAVLVGPNGQGPWQDAEIRAFLSEFVNRQCPVIPVILGSCTQVPELPRFLRQMMWVDFRKQHPDPMKQLCWGITGNRDS